MNDNRSADSGSSRHSHPIIHCWLDLPKVFAGECCSRRRYCWQLSAHPRNSDLHLVKDLGGLPAASLSSLGTVSSPAFHLCARLPPPLIPTFIDIHPTAVPARPPVAHRRLSLLLTARPRAVMSIDVWCVNHVQKTVGPGVRCLLAPSSSPLFPFSDTQRRTNPAVRLNTSRRAPSETRLRLGRSRRLG